LKKIKRKFNYINTKAFLKSGLHSLHFSCYITSFKCTHGTLHTRVWLRPFK